MPENRTNFQRDVDNDAEQIRDFLNQGGTRWVIASIIILIGISAVVLTFVHF